MASVPVPQAISIAPVDLYSEEHPTARLRVFAVNSTSHPRCAGLPSPSILIQWEGKGYLVTPSDVETILHDGRLRDRKIDKVFYTHRDTPRDLPKGFFLQGSENLRLEAVSVSAVAVNEKICSYRFDVDGRSIVVSGVAEYEPLVVEFSLGADILIVNTGTPRPCRAGNFVPWELGLLAEQAGIKKLVLNHLMPGAEFEDRLYAEILSCYSGDLIVAYGGLDTAIL